MAGALRKTLEQRKLKDILLSRRGQLFPQSSRAALPEEIFELEPINNNGITVSTINKPITQKKLTHVIDYMKKNFVTSAPVTKALGFDKLVNTSEVVDRQITKEYELLLTSGVSVLVEKEDKLVGVGASTFWAQDDNYEVVEDVSMLEWHNTAAEIATEVEDEMPEIVWREYQWQYTYNLIQSELRRLDRPFAIFYSNAMKSKEAAGNTSLNQDMVYPLQNIILKHGGITFTHTTHKYIRKAMEGLFHNSTTAGGADYKDHTLELNGRNVFKPLEKFGGIYITRGGVA